MAELIRLDPHDPLPDPVPGGAAHAVLIRRFGEDDPRAVITELDFLGRRPAMSLLAGPGGAAVSWEDAVHGALREVEAHGLATLYAVDRTAGRREQEVLAHGGDHSVRAAELSDTDEEDGELGTSLRDRTTNSGYYR